jgi:transposase-like protein
MPAGRKPLGIPEQVDRVPGSPVAKERLRVILANLAGEMSAQDACAALGIEESWFFELRNRSLARFAEAMEPETPGPRPAAPETPEQQRIAELEQRNRQLELHLEAARLRAELAAAGMTRSSRESRGRDGKKPRR